MVKENMANPPIDLELRKLGLTEKEAKVYLAGLELGPSSVQKISEMVLLPRPTAYEIIKKLEAKGLFAEIKENKKRHFLAQSPDKILGILRTQKKELEEKEREFIRIIASLESKYSKDQGGIKIYKEREGLKTLEEIISFTNSPEILIVNPQGRFHAIFEKIKKRLGRIDIKEYKLDIKGTLIIFEKAVFFPREKKEGYLFEDPIVVSLLKSLASQSQS